MSARRRATRERRPGLSLRSNISPTEGRFASFSRRAAGTSPLCSHCSTAWRFTPNKSAISPVCGSDCHAHLCCSAPTWSALSVGSGLERSHFTGVEAIAHNGPRSLRGARRCALEHGGVAPSALTLHAAPAASRRQRGGPHPHILGALAPSWSSHWKSFTRQGHPLSRARLHGGQGGRGARSATR